MPMMGGAMPNQQYGNVGGAKPNGWNGDVNNIPNQGQAAPWAMYQNSGKVPGTTMNVAQQPQVAGQARKVSFSSFGMSSV